MRDCKSADSECVWDRREGVGCMGFMVGTYESSGRVGSNVNEESTKPSSRYLGS